MNIKLFTSLCTNKHNNNMIFRHLQFTTSVKSILNESINNYPTHTFYLIAITEFSH